MMQLLLEKVKKWLSLVQLACLAICALIVLSTTTYALDSFSVQKARLIPEHFVGVLSLDGYLEVAIDQARTLDFEDVSGPNAPRFHSIAGHDLNLGFTRHSAWMRFALKLPSEAQQSQSLLLSIMPNFTDRLDVYMAVQKPNMQASDFRLYQMGDHSPRPANQFNTLANLVTVGVAPGETIILYINATSDDGSLNVSAEMYDAEHFGFQSVVLNIIRGMWVGAMTILLIMQFLFFYFDRRKFYIIISAYIIGVIFTYIGGLGLSRVILFSDGGYGNDYFTSASSWFSLASGALSIAGILDLRHRYPRLNYYFQFAAMCGLIGIGCVFAGYNRYFIVVAGPVIFVLTSIAMIVSLRDMVRSREAELSLNFAAFASLWLGLVLTNAQRYGVLSLPNWVSTSYAVSSILYFTLLTGALAVRLRKAEMAMRDAERRELVAANAAEQRANDLVTERTGQLAAAKRAAENALRAELDAQSRQVRFMEVISHQYRTPLAVIRSNLDSLWLTLTPTERANRDRLNRARLGVDRLVEVLEVNLTRSQIQGSSFKPSFVDVDVSSIVEASTVRAKDLCHGAEIYVEIDPAAGIAMLYADPTMLMIAVINLLENAFKFSAAVGSCAIWVKVDANGDEVAISVLDNGIGVLPSEVDRLSAHSIRGSNVEHIEGTGMGLSLVKRVAEAHGGSFRLSARSSGGAQAMITLPLRPAGRSAP